MYDRKVIDAILDEALICHLGIVHDEHPVVIPTIHARLEDTLYLHGSPASRMLRALKRGARVCVNVAIVDGIVAARSLFHNSMKYRSVVVFGEARLLDDPAERQAAFRAMSDHVLPGRWEDARRPSESEDRSTLIVALPLTEASAKVRTGPPGDDPEDVDFPVWAGVIPLTRGVGEPIPAPDLGDGVAVPDYVREFTARRSPGPSRPASP